MRFEGANREMNKKIVFLIFILFVVLIGIGTILYSINNDKPYVVVDLEYSNGGFFDYSSDYNESTHYVLYSDNKLEYYERYHLSGKKNKHVYMITDTQYEQVINLLENASENDKGSYVTGLDGAIITTYYYDKDHNLLGKYKKLGEILATLIR